MTRNKINESLAEDCFMLVHTQGDRLDEKRSIGAHSMGSDQNTITPRFSQARRTDVANKYEKEVSILAHVMQGCYNARISMNTSAEFDSHSAMKRRGGDLFVAAALLLGLVAIYFTAGSVFISAPDPQVEVEFQNPGIQDQFIGQDCFSVNDSSAVISQSLSLLRDGDLTFRPVEIPHMLHWSISGVEQAGTFSLPGIDDRLRDWIEAGVIFPVHQHPQIVKTTKPGVYLNCFGMGGAITAAPAFAVGQLLFGPLEQKPDTLDRLAFAQGSILVAVSAVFIYIALSSMLSRPLAILLALAYALGTCVFSTSSQGMWQHSATAFFATLALICLTRLQQSTIYGYALGVSMAMATLSRPTLGIVAAALALQFLITDRRTFLRYAIAGLPFALLLLYTNYVFLGSPFKFGQTALVDHAAEKTGIAAIWQTPTLTGLAGLLISPSRGLFVYSPFLLAAIPGIVMTFVSSKWAWARGIALAVPAIILVEAHHFDWWGGWSYGYRHLVDLSPFLVLLTAPVVPFLFRSLRWRIVFLALLFVSISIQIVGVTANDIWRWNAPFIFVLKDANGKAVVETPSFDTKTRWVAIPGNTSTFEMRNIDRVPYRDRLWSWSNNQIGYYLRNFARCSESRQAQMWNARQPHARKVAESYRQLALAYAKAQELSRATNCLIGSFEADPGYQEGLLFAWKILTHSEKRIDSTVQLLRQRTMLAPDDLTARIYLGIALTEGGDLLAAVSAFEDVLRRSTDEFDRRFKLGEAMMARRFRESELVRPSHQIHRDMQIVTQVMDLEKKALRAEANGDFDGAESAYREISGLLPNLPSLTAHRARLLLARGKSAEARDLLETGRLSKDYSTKASTESRGASSP